LEQGENPLRTWFYLYRGKRRRLTCSLVFYVIKHSPVWLMPLLTANIIDCIAARAALLSQIVIEFADALAFCACEERGRVKRN
jgi:hypothetical protein